MRESSSLEVNYGSEFGNVGKMVMCTTDLYIDVGKKSYIDLGLRRYGFFALAASLLSRNILDNGRKVNWMPNCSCIQRRNTTLIQAVLELNVGGNLWGDGFQASKIDYTNEGREGGKHNLSDRDTSSSPCYILFNIYECKLSLHDNQNGGVLIVDKGGKTLHLYVQDGPADHEDNAEIIKVI